MSLVLGIALGLPFGGKASVAVLPVGGLKSLVIADATPIDPVVYNSNPIGASGSGWVAIVVLKGLTSTGGTVDPTKLSLTVSDPGYDTSGNATTVSRTITGVAHLRRQYPNGASKMVSTDGIDLTLYIALDDWIYSGTTIVQASIASGFYPSSVASNAGAQTNNSTVAYTKPLFGWINTQNDHLLAASIYAIEAVAFHRHAKSAQQVACIKFTANDGTNSSATITASSSDTSAMITGGFGPNSEVWKATLDFSGLNAATMCTINAVVYPWLGDAPLNLVTDGAAWPTSIPQSLLNVYNDKTSTYGGAYAYVDGIGASPQVSNVPATARAHPYANIVAAAAAIKIWNNANRAHNDLGGSYIRLMDASGSPRTFLMTSNIVNSPGLTWCTIEADPTNTAIVTVTSTLTFGLVNPSLLRWRNLTALVPSTATTLWRADPAGSRTMLAVENVVIDSSVNTTNLQGYYGLQFWKNITVTGGQLLLNGAVANDPNICLMAGVTSAQRLVKITGKYLDPKIMVGCNLPTSQITAEQYPSGGDGDHGRVIYNNRAYNLYLFNASATTIQRGMANVQNMYEVYPNYGDAWSENYFADSDLTTIINDVEFHNTAVGERASRFYNDNIGTKVQPSGKLKIGVSKYCIWDNYNIKTDTFNNNAAGSVGNWAYEYSVGNVGNVSLFGQVNRLAGDLPHNDNGASPYLGCAWLPSSEPNLFRTALGFTQAQIMAMFTNYTTAPKGSPTNGGTYTPLTSATYLINRVPVGKGVLKYDLNGAVRRQDGTGAAGAYESV